MRIKLGQFEVHYQSCTAIKGQTLANFKIEFAYPINLPERHEDEVGQALLSLLWTLYIDGSSNGSSAGEWITLISPEGHEINFPLRFEFKASNNEAGYESLTAGLNLAIELRGDRLVVFSDSKLVVSQLNGDYRAKVEKVAEYLAYVQELIKKFK